ncbi:hypothetical protein [Flavobacterium foetidum]|uniref:hypothetical protein n=1 Tax=Flavobacterium foetidum TaxID=2026681 RepID=UPI0010751D3E|nr:hypothetical protein [Flavobacterium foetidum]KAF2517177.1 hypothetical protein E0W73_03515 [Flavobacterium foetidum]
MKKDLMNDFRENDINYQCTPDHIDTAHENEALDQEFTSGDNPDTNYRNAVESEFDEEIIESGLNLAEDNTPYSTHDDHNPYDSYNLDNEEEKPFYKDDKKTADPEFVVD